jgi:hypothetical protein
LICRISESKFDEIDMHIYYSSIYQDQEVFVFREETISLVLVQVVNNKMLVKKLKRMFFSYKKIMYRNFIITKPSNWEMDRDVKS